MFAVLCPLLLTTTSVASRCSTNAANIPALFGKGLKAVSVVMTLPGDWHTGLNMAQTIFTYGYAGFLEEFQGMLGWKRINKDVSSSYYQSTRLITFVFEELTRFFVHQFVSQISTGTFNPNAETRRNTTTGYAIGHGIWCMDE